MPTWSRPRSPRTSARSSSPTWWGRCAPSLAAHEPPDVVAVSVRRRGRCLAQPPREIAPRLEPRVLGEGPPGRLPVPALLEREAEAVLGLGQTRTPGERGPLLAERVLEATGVEIDEAEIAPDLRAVGIESRGRFELRHRLGQPALPVEGEPALGALRRLRALDHRRHGLGDIRFALGLPRAAIGVDQQRVDGKKAGVPPSCPLEGADGVARPAGSDEGRAEPVER